jgi:hypothetical protein
MRRKNAILKRFAHRDTWPIDQRTSKPPDGWLGWPEHKSFALVLTHDVDTAKGHNRCYPLMKLEESQGFRSTFYFVPERYEVSKTLLDQLRTHGFEIGVHGLIHDGKLYNSRKEFQKRALKINLYLKEWDCVGFRSPVMQHNLDWIRDLDIEYDASTFDTDPFEPQSDGAGTIFPFFVEGSSSQKGFLEIPYTLPHDFTLFIILKERNIEIWKKKIDWIAKNGGMVFLTTHPDYMNFNGEKYGLEEYPVRLYEEILQYIKTKYKGLYWHALPKDLVRYMKTIKR